MSRTGKLFIVAAPSGAGKTSLVGALVKVQHSMQISVSFTTRPKRPGDRDDIDYHFIDEGRFQSMIDEGAFLEFATVFDYHYGTSKAWVTEKLTQGIDVILEIDWQGARQIRQLFPNSTSIFILPPSLEVLAERLQKRGQDKQQVIDNRMSRNILELEHYQEFDYIVVNREFDDAVGDLASIVGAERLRLNEQLQAEADLLAHLLQND